MVDKLIVYADLLHEIKKRIRHAQVRAVLSANKEMILLYWDIGFSIAQRQIVEGWGAAIIPRLAKDIKNDIPEIKGFSERNLKRMIRFYREYPFLSEFVPPAVAQLETATADTKVPQAVALLSPEDKGQMTFCSLKKSKI